MTTQTPDVYVDEISTLSPSIAEVSTAIPAFIGYTEITEQSGKSLINTPVRISSLPEYKSYFGGPYLSKFTVAVANSTTVQYTVESIKRDADNQHHLYYALDHYFKNGGGDCYVVSVGNYDQTKSKDDFQAGLDAVAEADEPTLIVLSEACNLSNDADYYGLCQQALQQCGKLKDRFCIFDVLQDDKEAQGFRQNIGMENLKYGAAYYPFLNTSLGYIYRDADIVITGIQANSGNSAAAVIYSKELSSARVTYTGVNGDTPQIKIDAGTKSAAVTFTIVDKLLTISNVGDKGKTGDVIVDAWEKWSDPGKIHFAITKVENNTQPVIATDSVASIAPVISEQNKQTLVTIKASYTALYNAIKQELNKLMVVLPPVPAVAGAYASVDRERGVWKAPANVSLNAVISPTLKISADRQASMNVDPTSGKSINAIRSFFGKGTLIWGARTLAGNDNEWRYISVRRLFNMIEESAKKASYFAVFEPNDAATWLKVRGMIESYLYGLWQQGALAGSTPKSAYYVNVGLGTTMTQADILEGKMIVEIGLAAVRPAEFIVLNFSHKLQEA